MLRRGRRYCVLCERTRGAADSLQSMRQPGEPATPGDEGAAAKTGKEHPPYFTKPFNGAKEHSRLATPRRAGGYAEPFYRTSHAVFSPLIPKMKRSRPRAVVTVGHDRIRFITRH